MYKVFIITFGCKVNQYESSRLRELFVTNGYQAADCESDADIIVVNSCTVTASGDSSAGAAVRRIRREHPDAVIVLTGCMPQAHHDALERFCGDADIITGTKDRSRIPELVSKYLAERIRLVSVENYTSHDEFEELPCGESFLDTGRTRAFMKIQDGCNCFCSYCMIPYARGRCRSRALDSIAAEAKMLADSGYKEIVLVGINLAFYGREFGLRLVDAVEVCCRTDGIERVRVGSLEPEMISDDDLQRLSRLAEFCPQFHLSLQSGCDATLKRMNRKYTSDEYYTIVEKIRRYFPNSAITTDIMVAFPGETEEEFAESMAFAKKVGFASMHIFRYSPREGTPAAKMPQIDGKTSADRAERMKALADRLSEKYLASLVGKTVPVLFERERSDDFHQGHAPDHTLIKISRKNSKKSLRNSIFYVIIEESRGDHCYGEILDKKWR